MTSSDRPHRNVNIRIDLASIRHNLATVKSHAPNSKVMAVVKADAYGHGMANILPALGAADAFAVATMDEAMALRHAGESKPVLVLQGIRNKEHLNNCVTADLWPMIHDHYQLNLIAADPSQRFSCWLKFDTGMGRTGFRVEDSPLVHHSLKSTAVDVIGLMSHFASADNIEELSNDRQLREFNSIQWPGPAARSMANSAALLSRNDVQFDWVRPGLMLYGASPFADTDERSSDRYDANGFGLQPAMRVTASVIAIRDLKRGQHIGYGGRYRCDRPMKVAVVGAGYGDGYPRKIPDNTAVMLGNRRCPVVGQISMDSMVVDISELAVPPPIDYPVTLWGHEQLRVDEIARQVDTIPYELLCAIRGQRQWLDAPSGENVRKIDKDATIT